MVIRIWHYFCGIVEHHQASNRRLMSTSIHGVSINRAEVHANQIASAVTHFLRVENKLMENQHIRRIRLFSNSCVGQNKNIAVEQDKKIAATFANMSYGRFATGDLYKLSASTGIASVKRILVYAGRRQGILARNPTERVCSEIYKGMSRSVIQHRTDIGALMGVNTVVVAAVVQPRLHCDLRLCETVLTVKHNCLASHWSLLVIFVSVLTDESDR